MSKPDEMRQMKDLLNPKWRGKISTEDPTTTGAGANKAARFYVQLGEEFVQKSLHRTEDRAHPRAAADDRLAGARHAADLSQTAAKTMFGRWSKTVSRFSKSSSSPACPADDQRFAVDADRWPTRRRTRRRRRCSPTGFSPRKVWKPTRRGYGSATLRTDVDESFLNPGNLPKKGVKYFDDTDWKWIVSGRQENREKVWKLLKAR